MKLPIAILNIYRNTKILFKNHYIPKEYLNSGSFIDNEQKSLPKKVGFFYILRNYGTHNFLRQLQKGYRIFVMQVLMSKLIINEFDL